MNLVFFEESDIDAVSEFLTNYLAEAAQGRHLTFSTEVTKKTLSKITQSVDRAKGIIVKDDQDVICGFAAWTVTFSWFAEPEVDLIMFYVLPEYRGTGVARLMADYYSRIASSVGAKIRYTRCESGMSKKNVDLYKNLFAKFGYEYLGPVFMKVET